MCNLHSDNHESNEHISTSMEEPSIYPCNPVFLEFLLLFKDDSFYHNSIQLKMVVFLFVEVDKVDHNV